MIMEIMTLKLKGDQNQSILNLLVDIDFLSLELGCFFNTVLYLSIGIWACTELYFTTSSDDFNWYS